MSNISSALQNEIRQNKPFHAKTQEALLGLLKTADLMRRIVTSVLEPYGVTMQQYNVLRILRGAGEDEGELPTLAIRDRMIEQTPGITRLLDRLEARGWVERRRCAEDRRQVLCRISATGKELLGRLDDPMSTVDRAAVGALSNDEVAELVRLLDKVRAAERTRSR